MLFLAQKGTDFIPLPFRTCLNRMRQQTWAVAGTLGEGPYVPSKHGWRSLVNCAESS